MAIPTLSPFLLLTITSGGIRKLANGQDAWCVAKPSSSDSHLIANIEYACNAVSNCTVIQRDGACYLPNTNMNHASVAMNLYYQRYHRHPWNCDFNNSGLIVVTDPSYDGCSYPKS